MTTNLRDPKTLQGIDPRALLNYLQSTGWKCDCDALGGAAICTKSWAEEDWELLVPTNSRYADFALRIAEVFAALAEVEQRPKLQVFYDVLWSFADVVTVTLVHERSIQPMRLDDWMMLKASVKNMLCATACAIQEQKHVFATTELREARQKIESIQFTEQDLSSCCIRLVSASSRGMNPDESRASLQERGLEGSREIMATFIASCHVVAKTIFDLSQGSSDYYGMYEEGASANFMEELIKLGNHVTRPTELHFHFRWGWGGGLSPVTAIGSTLFSASDLVDLSALANKLKEPSRAFDVWLKGLLSSDTKAAIATGKRRNIDSPLSSMALVSHLNHLLRGALIYEENRFSDITLRPATQALLSHDPQGSDLVRLNRLLIEDAYPYELRRKNLTSPIVIFTHQLHLLQEVIDEYREAAEMLSIATERSGPGSASTAAVVH